MVPMTEEEKANRPLTFEEVREYLRIGRNAMTDLLKTGKLKGTKVGRQWRITKEALDEFLGRSPKG